MGLITSEEELQYKAAVIRPLLTLLPNPTPAYDSLCLKITTNKNVRIPAQSLWFNMLYRAYHLFDRMPDDLSNMDEASSLRVLKSFASHVVAPITDGHGENRERIERDVKKWLAMMGQHRSTACYEASMPRPLVVQVDKVNAGGDTLTTWQEGPYEVDLHQPSCQCRFFAGHPWVIYECKQGEDDPREEHDRHVFSGVTPKWVEKKETVKGWFPALDWKRHYIDQGSDPAVDCKHMVATHLMLRSVIAVRSGMELPGATMQYARRQEEYARIFGLFASVK